MTAKEELKKALLQTAAELKQVVDLAERAQVIDFSDRIRIDLALQQLERDVARHRS